VPATPLEAAAPDAFGFFLPLWMPFKDSSNLAVFAGFDFSRLQTQNSARACFIPPHNFES
jgi:hypothetical protein